MSSSSVYGDARSEAPVEEGHVITRPNNAYDLSKWAGDLWTMHLAETRPGVEAYGLRLGTVCGRSPNMREDVMLNAMAADALRLGEVRLYLEHTRRPVLGLSDLCRAVTALLEQRGDRRGLYNLCSFNGTVREYGAAVARKLGVPVRKMPEVRAAELMSNVKLQSRQYDFFISPRKFEQAFGFAFADTLDAVVDEAVQALRDPAILRGTRSHARASL